MLTIMIGIAGSGKTTIARRLAAETHAEWISSDAARAVFGISEDDHSHESKVWAWLRTAVDVNLSEGTPVIFDAMNLTRKNRKDFVKIGKARGVKVRAVVVNVPLDVALARNAGRDRKVPEDAITRMFNQVVFPTYEEGFDEIEFVENWNAD